MIKISLTNQLKDEHKVIKSMLRILKTVSEKLSSGEQIDGSDIRKIIKFIKNFADRCHHGKEEDVLFMEMERSGIPREGGPVGVMLYEHDTGRSYVRGMSEAFSALEKGETDYIKDFCKNAKGYIELLNQHIEKEDNILYPMAEEVISNDRKVVLTHEFEKVEEERMGHGKHEEFLKLVKELEEKYLR